MSYSLHVNVNRQSAWVKVSYTASDNLRISRYPIDVFQTKSLAGFTMKQAKNHKEAPQTGALSAVTSAFLEHSNFLKAFLRRFVSRHQDIEDIAQEAYIRAFKVEQNDSIDHPKTLLFTIAKNIALNELRSKSRRVTDYIEESQSAQEGEAPSTEEEVLGLERLDIYCEAVDKLPEQCRRVYLLRKVHGMSHKAIAQRLNITVRTVERHLAKGVLRCREQMREEGFTNGVLPQNGVTKLRREEVK